MKSISDEAGALSIAVEMISGLGRTGTWWGVHHTGVVPDIVTIGKAVGGGFPLSCLATTDEIGQSKPWSNRSGSSSSYGGNPLAAAAGAASLKIIEDENLVENSKRIGAIMLKELETWVDRYSFVGTARGSGMFMALELVSDMKEKTPLTGKVCDRPVDIGQDLEAGEHDVALAVLLRHEDPDRGADAADDENDVERGHRVRADREREPADQREAAHLALAEDRLPLEADADRRGVVRRPRGLRDHVGIAETGHSTGLHRGVDAVVERAGLGLRHHLGLPRLGAQRVD